MKIADNDLLLGSEQAVMRTMADVFDSFDKINSDLPSASLYDLLLTKIKAMNSLSTSRLSTWMVTENRNTADTELENAQLRIENYSLQQKIQSIETRLVNIESQMPIEKVVILRDISLEQAKKEVEELFSRRTTLYYSDIASELGISLETAVKICSELQESGAIEVNDGID